MVRCIRVWTSSTVAHCFSGCRRLAGRLVDGSRAAPRAIVTDMVRHHSCKLLKVFQARRYKETCHTQEGQIHAKASRH